MAATTAATSALVKSFFGAQKKQTVAASNGFRVVAMATKKVSVKSKPAGNGPQTWLPGVSIPALTEPAWLDRRCEEILAQLFCSIVVSNDQN